MQKQHRDIFEHYAHLAKQSGGAYQEIHTVLTNPSPAMLLSMWLEWSDQMAFDHEGCPEEEAFATFSAQLRELLEEEVEA